MRFESTAEGFELRGEATPVGRLLGDLWAARPLVAILARKDFYVRYRRASLGLLWAVGLPLFQAAVMAVVFSRVVRIETGVSYPVFLFAGLVAWSFFASTLGTASTAIVDGASLSNRIYFPRAVLPLVTVMANLYGFAISVGILLLLCLAFGVPLGPEVLLLLPATALLVALTAGFSLFTAAAHVYFRDVRYLVQASITAWFYATPVLYPLDLAPRTLQAVIKANPVTGVVQLFRAATVGADGGWASSVAVTCAWAVVLLAGSLYLHRRYDRVFADLL
jgi:lipopolysaccharide transport system permease protein